MASKFDYPRHYEETDEFPANTTGKVRLYSMEFCPYAERARLILEKHNVEYEIINVNLKKKPQWFLDRYHIGTVPVLEVGNKVIPESLICSEYIDEVYGKAGEQLVSNDPYERAQHKLLLDSNGRNLKHYYGKMYRGEEEGFIKYLNGLEEFEVELKTKAYFAGEKVGFVDYMLWPWFERCGAWVDEIPADRFPKITEWMKLMREDPVVIKVETPREYLKQIVHEYKNLTKRYDNIL